MVIAHNSSFNPWNQVMECYSFIVNYQQIFHIISLLTPCSNKCAGIKSNVYSFILWKFFIDLSSNLRGTNLFT